MILLELSDFNLYNRLAQSEDVDPVIEDYITRFEATFIKRILGVELGELFITDIQGEDSDSAAIEERFQTILDPFTKQDGCNQIYDSKGMKDILAGMVYYEYVIDTQAKHTQSGVVNGDAEVSNILSPINAGRFAEQKWNAIMPSIHAIQWWCGVEDEANYSEYAGTYIRAKYSNLL